MELRRIAVFMALFVLAISQCSDARHSMHRRQTDDEVNYDDSILADEANDTDAQNDTDNGDDPEPVKVLATIETPPKNYEVETGEDVRLECKVNPDNGTVVQWYRNNELYFIGSLNLHSEEVRYSLVPNSKDLLIKNVKTTDSGVFRCDVVQNAVNHTLLVIQKPMVISMSATNNGNVGEGSDLTVTCTVTGSPVPTVLWSITKPERPNERLTEKDGEFSVDGSVYSMYIKKVRPDDAGQYYCYAFNKAGNHQAEMGVVVNPKPRVHVTKTVMNSDLKIEAVLQCAAHEEPRAHIRWYKDGKLIEDSERSYTISTHGAHSNLTVYPTSDEDFGTFTCEAENNYGKHNRSIDLVQNPVVEELDVDQSKMTWVVHSHQPLEEMEVQLKPTSEDSEWRKLIVPLPQGGSHKYEITYLLDDKQIGAGEYQAIVKVKNSKGWSGSDEPVVVKIEDDQPQYIQHASVFRENNGADSTLTTYTALSTVLMYLLVRMF